MNIQVNIPSEMQRRVADIARRSGRSESQVIAEALEHGHSLEWQELFLERIARGIEAADRGEFATQADLDRIRHKHRQS